MDAFIDIYKFINGSVDSWITQWVEKFISGFSGILGLIMGTASDVLHERFILWGIAYAQALALSIIATKIAAESLSTYILYTNGDPDSDPSGLVVRAAQSVGTILSIPWILWTMFQAGTAIAKDVINIPGYQHQELNLLMFGYTLENLVAVLAILIIVAVIFLVIIFLQTNIRAAELGLLAIIGSILALNLTSPNRTYFSSWLKRVLVVTCTQGIQLLLIKAAFYSLATSIFTPGDMNAVLAAFGKFFGWLWVAYKTPDVLQQVVYSSGVSNVAGGAASQAGTMMLMRKVIFKA